MKAKTIMPLILGATISLPVIADGNIYLNEVQKYISTSNQIVFQFDNGALDFASANFKSSEGIDVSHEGQLGVLTLHSPTLAVDVRAILTWLDNEHGKVCGVDAELLKPGGYETAIAWGINYQRGYNASNCKAPWLWQKALQNNSWNLLNLLFPVAHADERASSKPQASISEKWSVPQADVELPNDDGDDDPNMAEMDGGFFAGNITKVSVNSGSGHNLPSWCSSNRKNSAETKLCEMMKANELLAQLDMLANKIALKIQGKSKSSRRIINGIIRSFCTSRDRKILQDVDITEVQQMYGEHIANFTKRKLIKQDVIINASPTAVVDYLMNGQ